jgi:YbbR domain-containing protein
VQIRNATRPVQLMTKQVDVHVRGPSDARARNAGEFDASIDVSALRPGTYDVPVRVVPPSRIGVINVRPSEVKVRIR